MTTTLTNPGTAHTTVSRAVRTTRTLPSATSSSSSYRAMSITQLHGADPDFQRGSRWNDSNTQGEGRAIVPSRSAVRRAQRVVAPHPSMFDNAEAGVWQRWSDNVEKFATSTGGMLVAATTVVLSMGLSPLFL